MEAQSFDPDPFAIFGEHLDPEKVHDIGLLGCVSRLLFVCHHEDGFVYLLADGLASL